MTMILDHLDWCGVRNGDECTCGLHVRRPVEPPAAAHHTPPTGPTVQTLADVAPERVSWLWPGRLPLGKLVVIDGDPSTGKSTLTLDFAARVSTGTDWPDGAPSRGPAGVLLLSAEDGVADTIVPRLTVAGADLEQVFTLTDVPSVNDDGELRRIPPSLPRDIPTIEKIVTEKKAALLVVDVLMAYLAGKVDSHRDQDVRGVLHQLATMAERTNCTVVLIRHLNKAGGSNALYRGGGSIGIVGAARAAFLVARDPDDEGLRIFAVTKSNLAVEPPSLAYRLVGDDRFGCARIEWDEAPVEHTAASLLRAPVDDDERSERDELADWLVDFLIGNGGQAPAKEVFRAGQAEGYRQDALKRAKSRRGIRSEKAGFGSGWVWRIEPSHSEGSTKSAKGAASESPLPSLPSVLPSSEPCLLHPDAKRASNGKCIDCIVDRANARARDEASA